MNEPKTFDEYDGFKQIDDMEEMLPYLDEKSRLIQEAKIAIATDKILTKCVSKKNNDNFIKMVFQHTR